MANFEDFEDEKEPGESEETTIKRTEKKRTNWQVDAIEERDVVNVIPDKFGLCSKCGHVLYERSKYGNEKVYCGYWGYPEKHPMSSADPVETCSCFKKAGEMDIGVMWKIAVLIDPKKGDGTMGF